MKSDLWVYIETDENGITDISLQSLAKGKQLATPGDSRLCCVVLGANLGQIHEDLIAHGADVIYLANDARLKDYTTTPYKKVICELVKAHNPEIFLFPASTQGNDLAPTIASSLQTGCVMDCNDVNIDGGLLLQKRVEYDGKVATSYQTHASKPQIATLKDGIADIAAADGKRQGEIVPVDVVLDESDLVTKVLKREVAKRTVNLKDAKVIVAAGDGVGSKENFTLIEELAEVLGGEVGATRPVVDAGWTAHERQIGQTGATVKPDLYIACGISGAVQHRVGMLASKTIISINIDPSAPIFRFSNYRIVADLTEVIPKLIKLSHRV